MRGGGREHPYPRTALAPGALVRGGDGAAPAPPDYEKVCRFNTNGYDPSARASRSLQTWTVPPLPCTYLSDPTKACGKSPNVPSKPVENACNTGPVSADQIYINPVAFDPREWSKHASKSLMNEIKHRVSQFVGPSSADRTIAHPVSQENLLSPCTVTLPVEYDLENAIISTVPPSAIAGSSGKFPFETVIENGWDVEQLYRPLNPKSSRSSIASRLKDYVYTGTGITGPYDQDQKIYGTPPISFATMMHCTRKNGTKADTSPGHTAGAFMWKDYHYSVTLPDPNDPDPNCATDMWHWHCIFGNCNMNDGNDCDVPRKPPVEGMIYDISCFGQKPNVVGWNACYTDSSTSFIAVSPKFYEDRADDLKNFNTAPTGQFYSAYQKIQTEQLLEDISTYHDGWKPIDASKFAANVMVANLLYRDKNLEESECDNPDQKRVVNPEDKMCNDEILKRPGVAAPWTYWMEDGKAQYMGAPSDTYKSDDPSSYGKVGLTNPTATQQTEDKGDEGAAVTSEDLENVAYMRTFPVDMRDASAGPGPYIATVMQPLKNKVDQSVNTVPGVSVFVGYNDGPQLGFTRHGFTRFAKLLEFVLVAEKVYAYSVKLQSKGYELIISQGSAVYESNKTAGLTMIDTLRYLRVCLNRTQFRESRSEVKNSGSDKIICTEDPAQQAIRDKYAAMSYEQLEARAIALGFIPTSGVWEENNGIESGKKYLLTTACKNDTKGGMCSEGKVWENAGRMLPNWGAKPLFVYAPLLSRIDIGAGASCRVQRPRQVVRYQPETTALCPDSISRTLIQIRQPRVPTLIGSVEKARSSGALSLRPRSESFAKDQGNQACALAVATSVDTTIIKDVPWLRDQFLGLYYEVTIDRDASGYRRALITSSASPGTDPKGLRGLLATALTIDENDIDKTNDTSHVRTIPPAMVGAPGKDMVATSALMQGDPLTDCALLTTSVGAVNTLDRQYYNAIISASGSTKQGISCLAPVCTSPDELAMRAPQARFCAAQRSICSDHFEAVNNKIGGKMEIRKSIQFKCNGDTKSGTPT